MTGAPRRVQDRGGRRWSDPCSVQPTCRDSRPRGAGAASAEMLAFSRQARRATHPLPGPERVAVHGRSPLVLLRIASHVVLLEAWPRTRPARACSTGSSAAAPSAWPAPSAGDKGGGAEARTHTVDVDPVIVGRDPGVDLPVADPEVSGSHCELRAVGEGVLLQRSRQHQRHLRRPAAGPRGAAHHAPPRSSSASARLHFEPTAKRRVEVGYQERFGVARGRVAQDAPRVQRPRQGRRHAAQRAAARRDRHRQGGRRPRGPRRQPARRASPSSSSTAAASRRRWPRACSSGTSAAPSPAPTSDARARWPRPTAARSSSTSSASCRSTCSPSCSAPWPRGRCAASAGSAFEPIDVRVVAATRRDLSAEMNAGRFRSDLFFRIAQVRVEMPALRERLGDVPQLVEEICRRVGHAEHAAAVNAWIESRMPGYDWPGNVRELVNVASVAATLAGSEAGTGRRRASEAIDDVLLLTREPHGASRRQRCASGPQSAFGEAKRSGHRRLRAQLLHLPRPRRQRQRQRDGPAERHGAPPRARLPPQATRSRSPEGSEGTDGAEAAAAQAVGAKVGEDRRRAALGSQSGARVLRPDARARQVPGAQTEGDRGEAERNGQRRVGRGARRVVARDLAGRTPGCCDRRSSASAGCSRAGTSRWGPGDETAVTPPAT